MAASGTAGSTTHRPPTTPSGSGGAIGAIGASQLPDGSARIRGSCECCAKSKVRCGKEKPTCARCLSRGTQCLYLASRRPGRVPGMHSSKNNARQRRDQAEDSATTQQQHQQESTSSPLDNSHHPSTSTLPAECALMLPLSPSTSTTASDSTLPDPAIIPSFDDLIYTSATPTHNSEYQSDWYIGLDGFATDPTSMDMLSSVDEVMLADILDAGMNQDPSQDWTFNHDGNDSTTACTTDFNISIEDSAPANVFTDGESMQTGYSTPVGSSSPTSSTAAESMAALLFASASAKGTFPVVSALDPALATTPGASCDCVAQALEILKALSKSTPQSPHHRKSSKNVLEENKQSIESTMGLLSCEVCKDDQFLLVLSLMIAMKLLGRYESVAGACNSPENNADASNIASSSCQVEHTSYSQHTLSMSAVNGLLPTVSRGSSSSNVPTYDKFDTQGDGANDRASTQSVLRELHRVQKLITHLPLRLKSGDRQQSAPDLFSGVAKGQDTTNRIALQACGNTDGSCGDASPTSTLSARALALWEEDVRSSLKNLSAFLRNKLKNS